MKKKLFVALLLFATSLRAQSITGYTTACQPGCGITITGMGFGTAQSSSFVSFNGITATATNWSDTSLTVTVPNGAQTGPLFVTVNGAVSNKVNFIVTDDLSQPLVNNGADPQVAVASAAAIKGVLVGARAEIAGMAALASNEAADIKAVNDRIAAVEARLNNLPPPVPGPPGPAGTISIGSVITGAPGSQAAVTNSGTPSAAMLNLTIPQGPLGPPVSVNIGSVITGAPGSPATVTNSGTPSAPILNFTIPQGLPGTGGSAKLLPFDIQFTNCTGPFQSFSNSFGTFAGNFPPGTRIPCNIPLVPAGTYSFVLRAGDHAAGGGQLHIESPAGTTIGTVAVNFTANWNIPGPSPGIVALPAGATAVIFVCDFGCPNLFSVN